MLKNVWDVLQRMLNKIKISVLREREKLLCGKLSWSRTQHSNKVTSPISCVRVCKDVVINPHSICLLKTKILLVRVMARQKSPLTLVMVAAIPTNFGYTDKV